MTDEPKEPRNAVLTALHAVMASEGYVQKKGRNEFHKYNYASEGDLLEIIRPAMVEAGLLLIPNVKDVSPIDNYGNINVIVEYTLAHKDGEVWPEKITVVGAGNDKNSKGGVGDKGIYKAMTGANKYLLFKLFQIATGDDPEKKNEEEPPAKVSGGNRMHGPLPITALKNKMRDFASDLANVDESGFVAMLNDYKDILDQCMRDLPDWYYSSEHNLGAEGRIEEKRRQFDMDAADPARQGPLDVEPIE